ncbi:MAG: response regulator, partial [Armatimonadota bacterium]|nr:response regulator [Armatimonadota bacterium]
MENIRHRILVVDDESIIAMDLRQKLTRLGYDVPATASSAEEALEKVAELRPDLVLMDIRLEGSAMDGVEAAERIRDQFGTPVVFLTAFADDETLQRAKLTGPYGYLVKPFTESELRIEVEIAIHTSQTAALLRRHARQQAAIAEFSQRALSEMQIDVLLEEAVAQVAGTLHLECCSIGELLPDGKRLWLRAGVGWREEMVGQTAEVGSEASPGTTLDAYVLASSQPVVVEDWPSETRFTEPDLLREHGITSSLSAVIHGAEGPLGVLAAHAKMRRGFTPDDVNFLQAIANVVSQAIRRKAAEEGLKQARDDIEERKRAEQEKMELLRREQEARQEAEAANRAKDEFLAVVSHELRTPLTSIMGWASLLRDGRLNEQATAQALEVIERQTRVQAQLVEDILDVARIITGKLHMEFVPVDPANVITAAMNAAHPTADAKGIQMKLLIEPGVGQVWGDANRLQQVVWNLLSNAIKFTPKGGKVGVRLERHGSDVLIRVSDTGQGIAPEFLPHVFERFRQADGSTTRAHGGLGLGLAVVRH